MRDLDSLINKLKRRATWVGQFMRFGIVGTVNTMLGLASYEILVYWGIHPQFSNLIAFLISVINAYVGNFVWVFKCKAKKLSAFKFFTLYLSTFLLSAILLFLWVDILSVNKFIAPVLSLVITIPLNFVVNKFWVFKDGESIKQVK